MNSHMIRTNNKLLNFCLFSCLSFVHFYLTFIRCERLITFWVIFGKSTKRQEATAAANIEFYRFHNIYSTLMDFRCEILNWFALSQYTQIFVIFHRLFSFIERNSFFSNSFFASYRYSEKEIKIKSILIHFQTEFDTLFSSSPEINNNET